MKKNLLVKFASLFTLFTVFALLLALSPTAFAAAAPNAANADAEVKGLWLKCLFFPEDAEVLEFTDDKDMDMVTYIRGLDAGLTFEIRRQPIEGSELQSTDDVRGLIEVRVNNEDISEEALEENFYSIRGTSYAEGVDELSSYPFVSMEYYTGAGEDRRRNVALFIFTDVYCFEVNFSMPDGADYGSFLSDCFTSLEFAGSESGGDGGGDADEGTPDAGTADAEVTGLWLEMPAFPKGAESEIDISDNGQVVYMRTLEDGALSLVISRIPNPDNAITPELVGTFISNFSGVSEDDLEINVPDPHDEPIFPLAGLYPFASAEYETEGEDGEEPKHNIDFCFFPDEHFFWVHMEVADEDVMEEKYEDGPEQWFRGIRIVDRSLGGEDAPDADVTGLWLEIPSFPKDSVYNNVTINDENGFAAYSRSLDDGDFMLQISRRSNPGNEINPETVGTFISNFADVSEDDLFNITIQKEPDDDDPRIPLAGEYPFFSAQYESESDGVTKHNLDLCLFPDEIFFFIHIEAVSAEALGKHEYGLEAWFRDMRIVER